MQHAHTIVEGSIQVQSEVLLYRLGPWTKKKNLVIITTFHFNYVNGSVVYGWEWGGGGANNAKVDQTPEMYFLLSDLFI